MAIYNLYDPEGKSLIKEFEAKYGRVSASFHYSASSGADGCRSSEWVAKRESQSLQEQIWCCTECSSSGTTPECGKPDTHEFFGHVRQNSEGNCTCKCDEYLLRAELRWSGSAASGSLVDPLWINI